MTDDRDQGSDVLPKILAVMGLPRTGTSLTMQMLDAGGFPCELGAGPPAFEHPYANIDLADHLDWLETQRGRAVKLLDPLAMERHAIGRFPRDLGFDVICCLRGPKQAARSQIKMMKAVFPALDDSRETFGRLAAAARRDQKRLIKFARSLDRRALFLRFERTLADPARAARLIQDEVGYRLDLAAMARLVVPRGPACLDGFLEERLALDWDRQMGPRNADPTLTSVN